MQGPGGFALGSTRLDLGVERLGKSEDHNTGTNWLNLGLVFAHAGIAQRVRDSQSILFDKNTPNSISRTGTPDHENSVRCAVRILTFYSLSIR
jgi:hypothetical protein